MQPLNTQRLAKRFSCVYWRGGWQAGCNNTLRPREQRASSVRCSHLGTSESVCLASDHTTMCRPECGGASAKARCRCRRIGLVDCVAVEAFFSFTDTLKRRNSPLLPLPPLRLAGVSHGGCKTIQDANWSTLQVRFIPFSFKSLFLPHLLSPPSPPPSLLSFFLLLAPPVCHVPSSLSPRLTYHHHHPRPPLSVPLPLPLPLLFLFSRFISNECTLGLSGRKRRRHQAPLPCTKS